MANIINITDKLSTEKSKIQIGEKLYELEDSMEVVLKFEETASTKGPLEAVKLALGEAAYEEAGVSKLSVKNFKVLMIGIMAAMQDISYEDAAARFQQQGL